jgi:hypothetical protein
LGFNYRHAKYEEQLNKTQRDQIEAFDRDTQKVCECT